MAYKDPADAKRWREENKARLKEWQKVYQAENKDRLKAKSAARYQKNKELHSIKSKKYARDNAEKIKQNKRAWRKRNMEKILADNKKWQSENKDKFRYYCAKRHANKMRAMPSWLTTAQTEEIKLIYATCPDGWQVDHVVPLQGTEVCGLHVPWNLQHLPATENRKKGNKLVNETWDKERISKEESSESRSA